MLGTQHLTSAGNRNEATLFVGDLPPYFKNDDLEGFFGQFGELERVRVMGGQCYAFVTFQRTEVVQHIIDKYHQKPLTIAGHELRINKAHGQLPDWKVHRLLTHHPAVMIEDSFIGLGNQRTRELSEGPSNSVRQVVARSLSEQVSEACV
jgi:RNA recognition motif-containing protein